jgi:hypothetical protein
VTADNRELAEELLLVQPGTALRQLAPSPSFIAEGLARVADHFYAVTELDIEPTGDRPIVGVAWAASEGAALRAIRGEADEDDGAEADPPGPFLPDGAEDGSLASVLLGLPLNKDRSHGMTSAPAGDTLWVADLRRRYFFRRQRDDEVAFAIVVDVSGREPPSCAWCSNRIRGASVCFGDAGRLCKGCSTMLAGAYARSRAGDGPGRSSERLLARAGVSRCWSCTTVVGPSDRAVANLYRAQVMCESCLRFLYGVVDDQGWSAPDVQ